MLGQLGPHVFYIFIQFQRVISLKVLLSAIASQVVIMSSLNLTR